MIATRDWDFSTDIVDRHQTPLVPIDDSKHSFHAVASGKGVYYRVDSPRPAGPFGVPTDPHTRIVLDDGTSVRTILDDVVVRAWSTDHTCLVVHDRHNHDLILIDTRGVPFRLMRRQFDDMQDLERRDLLHEDLRDGTLNAGAGSEPWLVLRHLSAAEARRHAESIAPVEGAEINPAFLDFLAQENGVRKPFRYVSFDAGKKAAIITHLIEQGMPHERVPNMLSSDKTLNIRVPVYPSSRNRKDVHYVVDKYASAVDEYHVCGLPFRRVLRVLGHGASAHPFSSAQTDIEIACVQIAQTLRISTGAQSDSEVSSRLFGPLVDALRQPDYIWGNRDWNYEAFKQLPIKRQERAAAFENRVIAEIAESGGKIGRWASELKLFAAIRGHYPDAVYQFRAPWLGQQSLDVFVPSLNLGVEYQGKQHYEPVGLFGGEEGLIATQARDARKRGLCKENGVRLLEWPYSSAITSLRVKQQLEAAP